MTKEVEVVKRIVLVLAALTLPVFAFAQEAAPAAVEAAPAVVEAAAPAAVALNWSPIAAAGIGVLVMLLVQLVGVFVPKLDTGVKQVIALVASPLLTWLGSVVSNALGYPVDFSSLVDALVAATGSGLTAMGMFDVLKTLGAVGQKK